MKSPKNFTICENCPADQLKANKIGVTNIIFLLFAILCFLPDLHLKFGPMNFLINRH